MPKNIAMKKIALLCFAVMGFITTKAQLEWAPVGAKYYYKSYTFTAVGVSEIEVIKDTIVLGKNCRVFQDVSQQTLSGLWGTGCEGDHIMYEENGRVYFFRAVDQEFNLLFDFTKGPGETWDVPLCEEWQCYRDTLRVHVDSVTYSELNGVMLKRQHIGYERIGQGFTFPYFGTVELIYEGIGSIGRPFLLGITCPVIDLDISGLNCYESPTLGTFNFRGDVPCNQYLSTSTEEPTPVTSQLKLYPNPVSNELELRFTPQLSGRVQVRVFDARGRLVEDIQRELAGGSLSLRVTGWPAGMYVLSVMQEGAVLDVEKFVKQ